MTGVSYQTAHTYFFVPKSAGASTTTTSDDVNQPGAYFRLGGVSDIESNASADVAAFYPRQHKAEEGTDAAAKTNAAGASGLHGIALACSGRLLIRSAEKLYVHSTGPMHIDTQGTLKVNADKAMTINSLETISIKSGANQKITISAGDANPNDSKDYSKLGDLSTKSKKTTIDVAGSMYEKVTEDKYSYFQADSYSIQMGRENKISLGGRFTIWIGASVSFNIAIDLVFSAATSFAFFIVKFDAGIWKFDFFGQKIDIQKGEIKVNAWTTKAAAAATTATAASSSASAVQTNNAATAVVATAVSSASNAVAVNSGAAAVTTNTVNVVT